MIGTISIDDTTIRTLFYSCHKKLDQLLIPIPNAGLKGTLRSERGEDSHRRFVVERLRAVLATEIERKK